MNLFSPLSAYSTRLVNGGANYGRLEITIDGMTGTVCDQGWGSRDPEVACREMGFQSGSASTGSAYGRGAGMFWLSSVACSGRETSILQCAHPGLGLSTSTYWTWRCSSHGYDAGAHCFGSGKCHAISMLFLGWGLGVGAVDCPIRVALQQCFTCIYHQTERKNDWITHCLVCQAYHTIR